MISQDALDYKPSRNAYSVRVHSLSSELHHINMKVCDRVSREGTDSPKLYVNFTFKSTPKNSQNTFLERVLWNDLQSGAILSS
jgi:hypothetical protein